MSGDLEISDDLEISGDYFWGLIVINTGDDYYWGLVVIWRLVVIILGD